MLFKIETIDVKQKNLDVELPRYSRHDLDHSTLYHKLDEGKNGGLFVYKIAVIRGRPMRVELAWEALPSTDLGRDGDYYLGRGAFAATADEWNSAIETASLMFARFK